MQRREKNGEVLTIVKRFQFATWDSQVELESWVFPIITERDWSSLTLAEADPIPLLGSTRSTHRRNARHLSTTVYIDLDSTWFLVEDATMSISLDTPVPTVCALRFGMFVGDEDEYLGEDITGPSPVLVVPNPSQADTWNPIILDHSALDICEREDKLFYRQFKWDSVTSYKQFRAAGSTPAMNEFNQHATSLLCTTVRSAKLRKLEDTKAIFGTFDVLGFNTAATVALNPVFSSNVMFVETVSRIWVP